MLLATIERFPFLFELQQAAHKIRINILPQRLLRKDVDRIYDHEDVGAINGKESKHY